MSPLGLLLLSIGNHRPTLEPTIEAWQVYTCIQNCFLTSTVFNCRKLAPHHDLIVPIRQCSSFTGRGIRSLHPTHPQCEGTLFFLNTQAWTEHLKCGSRGGYRGSGPPWKITSYMGFYREKVGPPPPWKMDLLWNLEK